MSDNEILSPDVERINSNFRFSVPSRLQAGKSAIAFDKSGFPQEHASV